MKPISLLNTKSFQTKSANQRASNIHTLSSRIWIFLVDLLWESWLTFLLLFVYFGFFCRHSISYYSIVSLLLRFVATWSRVNCQIFRWNASMGTFEGSAELLLLESGLDRSFRWKWRLYYHKRPNINILREFQ